MDPKELAYIEQRGFDGPLRRSQDAGEVKAKDLPRYEYHSRLSGKGIFGVSAYGLILLAIFFLFCLVLFILLRLLFYITRP
ncbi:hypothetical protein MBLNU230_g0749t1 [Neophaeotheca triangularis]